MPLRVSVANPTLKAGRNPPSAIFMTRASASVVEARGSAGLRLTAPSLRSVDGTAAGGAAGEGSGAAGDWTAAGGSGGGGAAGGGAGGGGPGRAGARRRRVDRGGAGRPGAAPVWRERGPPLRRAAGARAPPARAAPP